MTNDRQQMTSMGKKWLDRISELLLHEPKDREQLINLLRSSEENRLLDADALAMIEGVLQVSEMQVRDIMIPRSQMVVVNENASLQDFLPQIINSGHSRFPVISNSKEEILGILHAKDLLPFANNQDGFNLLEIIRPAVVVPESKRLNVLLKEFRSNRNHMAMVVDEYGGISGCVTIEDIIEQIVGEIEDEFDVDEDAFIKKHNHGDFVVKAHTPIADFNQYFQTQFSDNEFDTIGGLVIHQFGHLPQRGEITQINDLEFHVIHADSRRVRLLKVNRK